MSHVLLYLGTRFVHHLFSLQLVGLVSLFVRREWSWRVTLVNCCSFIEEVVLLPLALELNSRLHPLDVVLFDAEVLHVKRWVHLWLHWPDIILHLRYEVLLGFHVIDRVLRALWCHIPHSNRRFLLVHFKFTLDRVDSIKTLQANSGRYQWDVVVADLLLELEWLPAKLDRALLQ